jgi:hypothetical protein
MELNNSIMFPVHVFGSKKLLILYLIKAVLFINPYIFHASPCTWLTHSLNVCLYLDLSKRRWEKLGVVVHICNPRTWEAATGWLSSRPDWVTGWTLSLNNNKRETRKDESVDEVNQNFSLLNLVHERPMRNMASSKLSPSLPQQERGYCSRELTHLSLWGGEASQRLFCAQPFSSRHRLNHCFSVLRKLWHKIKDKSWHKMCYEFISLILMFKNWAKGINAENKPNSE